VVRTSSASASSDTIVSTLDKGLRVLEVLATDGGSEGLTLTELAQRLDMHRTTLFRLLATLRARNFVSRELGTDRYRLGIQILALASSLLKNLDIREVARPALLALREQTQELVHLAVLDGTDIVTVERIEGGQPISLQTEIGARRPLYCTASGKAVLAFLPDHGVDSILAQGMPRVTANTIIDAGAMRRHLGEVRQHGYAWDDEERIEGVRCVAAPVFGHDGSVLGAISIAAPALRMPWERMRALGEEVRRAADVVSQQLGSPVSAREPEARSQESLAGVEHVGLPSAAVVNR
jgi:IclR family transcriptional regulator, KDG regulon repressor